VPQPDYLAATNPTRLIARFGGAALPQGQGTMTWQDLNDLTTTYMNAVALGEGKIVNGTKPLLWRSKGVYLNRDFQEKRLPMSIMVDEAGGTPINNLKAVLSQAGVQDLTFDNATYVSCVLDKWQAKQVRTYRPFRWNVDLEFVAAEPWAKDFQASGSLGNLLNPNGGFEGAAVAPTLLDSRTIVQSNDFESAPSTVDYFHSIGIEALGTLAAWTQQFGAWSIASNIVSGPATDGGYITAGHADTGDCTFTQRIQWNTGTTPGIAIHSDAGANMILAQADGGTLYLSKRIASGALSTVNSVAAGLVNGTYYWLKLQGAGTNYTATIYADSAGAVGASIATTGAQAITDLGLQYGLIGLRNGGAVSNKFGGAFTNVCYVTGPAPTGWTTNLAGGSWATSGEPAFCWSAKQSYYGTHSLSIYHAVAAVNNTAWIGPTSSALTNAVSYQVNGYTKLVGAAGGLTARDGLVGGFAITSSTSATWAAIGTSCTGTGAGVQVFFGPTNGGTGTIYFDYATIIQPAVPSGVLYRSLGTDATGTLYAWPMTSGVTSIAGNKVSLGPSAYVQSGHADWGDGTWIVRGDQSSLGLPFFDVHCNSNNSINFGYDGTNWSAFKTVAGSAINLGSVISGGGSGVFLGTSSFWLEITALGTSYTFNLYKDAAGFAGDFIAGSTFTITESAVQNGQVRLRNAGSTSNATFGGSYANVLLVQGALPTGWTPSATWTTSEPAFCWDKATVYSGAHSGSVYIPSAQSGWTGQWQISGTATSGTAAYAAYVRQNTGDAGAASVAWSAGSTSATTPDSTFHRVSGTTAADGSAHNLVCKLTGGGTAFFDACYLQNSNDSTTGLYTGDFFDQVALPGTTGGSTTVATVTYNGSVFAEPKFIITIPNTNPATISQIKVQNTLTGEILTIAFSPVLAATTAYTLTIDSAAMTVTDQNGNQYPWTGAFPTLAPVGMAPAGTQNSLSVTVTTGTGTASGITLDASWVNRWEI